MVRPFIKSIDQPKRHYNPYVLNRTCAEFLYLSYRNYYCIYTDGSKVDNSAGAAFYDPQSKNYLTLNIMTKEICIMNVELIAIAEAISYIESLDSDNFVIFTDSRSALQHLARCTSNIRGTPIAYTIIKSINSLQNKNKNIVLQWVPSHIGLGGNTEVDILAKQSTTCGISLIKPPYFADLFGLVKKNCMDIWDEYFDERSLTKGIWYKTMQPYPSRFLWFEKHDLSRTEIVTALRLRSGHIPLNSFRYMIKISDTPNCRTCKTLEDVYHVLVECVRNEAERTEFERVNKVKLHSIGYCNTILSAPSSEKAKLLYKMVNVAVKNS